MRNNGFQRLKGGMPVVTYGPGSKWLIATLASGLILLLPVPQPVQAQRSSDGEIRVGETIDPISGARYRQAVCDLTKKEIKAVQRALREDGYRDEYIIMVGEFCEETPAGEPWWIWAGMPEDPADHHVCNGGEYKLVPAWEYQDVVRDHRVNSLEKRKGARLAVWTDEFFDVLMSDGWCAAVSLPQIAVGEAGMEMRNDNDYYGQTGHNVWG